MFTWELPTSQEAPSLKATVVTGVRVWIQETSAVINTPVCHVRHSIISVEEC